MATRGTTFSPVVLNISKLKEVLKILKRYKFTESRWHELGLELGLYQPTLEAIRANCPTVGKCLLECLTKWLNKSDDVTLPTWQLLGKALIEIEERAVGESILKTMATPASQLLQKYSDRLTRIVLTPWTVQLLHTEGVISEEIASEVESNGCSLVGDPLIAIYTTVAEDHNKLKLLADILMNIDGAAMSLANEIAKEYGDTFMTTAGTSCPPTHILGSVVEVPLYSYHGVEIDKMRDELGILLDDLAPLIQNNIPSLDNLKTFLRRIRPELDRQLSQPSDYSEKYPFNHVMKAIEGKCTIINITVLERIVERYSVKEANCYISAYKVKMEEFCSLKNSLRICNNAQLKILHTSHLTCDTIMFTLNWNMDKHTLNEVNGFLTKAFSSMANRVEVVEIRDDKSITVTCYAPHYLMESLLVIASGNLHLLKKEGLISLTIGYYTVYDERVIIHEMTVIKKQHDNAQQLIKQLSDELSTTKQQLDSLLMSYQQKQKLVRKSNFEMTDILWQALDNCEFDVEAIGYLVGDDKLENLASVMDTFVKWNVAANRKKALLAAILFLGGHQNVGKKLDPGISRVPAAVSILTASIDGDQGLIDKIKMRSLLIFLCNKLTDNGELQNKFVTILCSRIELPSRNYKGRSLFKLFKKMKDMTELAPNNLMHIEEVLKSDENFKNILKEYNHQKELLFQLKENESDKRPSELQSIDFNKLEPDTVSVITNSGHSLSLQPQPVSNRIIPNPQELPLPPSPLTAQEAMMSTLSVTSSTNISTTEKRITTAKGPQSVIASARNAYSQKYIEMPDIPARDFFSPWPKLDRTHYVTLALITNRSITRDDDFTHRTLRKSEDDIPSHKYFILYENVIPQTLERSSRILISGRPGAGKTVLLTKVSKDWAKGKCLTNVKLLLHIPLHELAAKTDTPSLEDILSLIDPSQPHSLCETINKLNGEGVCFALDGLDEYPNRSKSRDYIMKLIHKENLSLASVIITSRPTATRDLRKESMNKHVEIVGFMPEQIEEYITDYYKMHSHAGSPTAGADLLKYLKDHPNIMDMCYLPLHLAMILYINQNKGENESLPETETDIYSCFMCHSIMRYIWSEKHGSDLSILNGLELAEKIKYIGREKPESELSINGIKDLEKELAEESTESLELFYDICHIAFKTKISSQIIFTSKYLRENFPEKFGLRSDITRLRKNGLGILSRYTMKSQYGLESQFNFQHRTVQEFLGAYHLSRQEHNECLSYIRSYGKSNDMREFWKYFCGITKDSGSIITYYNELLGVNSKGRNDTLFLARCAFEAQGTPCSQECCIAFLKSREKEGAVDVSNIVLSSPDCSAIGYSISQCPEHLKQLVMNYCQVGPGGVDALNNQMANKTFPNVSNMQIRSQSNPVGRGEGGTKLKSILEKMPNLQELRLYGNQLSSAELLELEPVVAPMTNLTILVLSKNNLGSKSGATIGAILHNMEHLIQFYYNPIGTEGLEALMPGLLNCTKLKRLGFRGCQLTSDAGKFLSEILSQLQELQQLELYWNHLEDEGVSDMVERLKDAPQLKQMSLTKNGITDKGGCLLAEVVIKSSASIEQIRLYYNDVSFETRKVFYDAVKYREQNGLNELRYAI